LVHHQFGRDFWVQGADIRGLEYGAQRRLGGDGVLAQEVVVDRHHAAVVLRPGLVGHAVGHNVANLFVVQLLGRRGEGQDSVDVAVNKALLGLRRRQRRPSYLYHRIDVDVGQYAGEIDVIRAVQLADSQGLAPQVADVMHMGGTKQDKTA